jgi:hypothetical protein
MRYILATQLPGCVWHFSWASEQADFQIRAFGCVWSMVMGFACNGHQLSLKPNMPVHGTQQQA